MPRPRQFSETHDRRRLADAYLEGRSTREIAELSGLSRWIVVARLGDLGLTLRRRIEGLSLRKYFDALEGERIDATRCSLDGCFAARAEGAICVDHWADFLDQEGRDCAWPRCTERGRGEPRFCFFHRKRADGLIAA